MAELLSTDPGRNMDNDSRASWKIEASGRNVQMCPNSLIPPTELAFGHALMLRMDRLCTLVHFAMLV